MGRLVRASELQRRDTIGIARWLLGKLLVRTCAGRSEAWLITEVEAYHGERDLACHASKGRTARTEVLYGRGGVWYVYLCYGVHEMLNLVTGPAGHPSAVLIRGVKGITGPGRLTKALGIGRRLNGVKATRESGLHLENHGIVVPRRLIEATPRIGVGYAGPKWAVKPWRFIFDPQQLPARERPGRSG